MVAFRFILDPKGVGLPHSSQPLDVLGTLVTSFPGLTALAGGLILIYPVAIYDAVGILLFAGSRWPLRNSGRPRLGAEPFLPSRIGKNSPSL